MVRFIALNAFMALYTIVMCIVALVLAPFTKDGRLIHLYSAVPWAKGVLTVCGVTVVVKGAEGVNPEVPRIYMTNHQSAFDIFAVLACVPVHFKFILKQELMRIPLFGQAVARAGYIGIERKDPRKAIESMNAAADRIRAGASVLIFPEGTRSPDGVLGPFKKGGFHLAVRSGCDIVPISITDSYRIVPKGSLRINKGTFTLRIGAPIPVAGCGKKDVPALMDTVRTAILGGMEHPHTEEPGESGARE